MVPGDTLGALLVEWNGVNFKIGSGFDAAERKRLNTHFSILLILKVACF